MFKRNCNSSWGQMTSAFFVQRLRHIQTRRVSINDGFLPGFFLSISGSREKNVPKNLFPKAFYSMLEFEKQRIGQEMEDLSYKRPAVWECEPHLAFKKLKTVQELRVSPSAQFLTTISPAPTSPNLEPHWIQVPIPPWLPKVARLKQPSPPGLHLLRSKAYTRRLSRAH